MAALKNITLLTNKLVTLAMPSNITDNMRKRQEVKFYMVRPMAEVLQQLWPSLLERYPLGLTVDIAFASTVQQSELFAAYRTGRREQITAPPSFSSREAGRALDLDVSQQFTGYIDDGDDDPSMALTIKYLQSVLEPVGFINVTDGRADIRSVWKAEGDILHLEYWADLLPDYSEFDQAFRDQSIPSQISQLYQR